MNKWVTGLTTALFGWTLCLSQAMASTQADEAGAMVQSVSEKVVAELNQNRTRYEGNPQAVKAFAEEYVLPYVDTFRMARYVMGRYWKLASETQQEAFAEAFKTMLLRSYSKSLLKLEIDSVKVTRITEERPGRASIQSEVLQADGNASRVDYRAYYSDTKQRWLLYDMTVEGVSLLLNYRKTYGSEFASKGVARVINELESKNQEALAEQSEAAA
ncbi:phospholipid-binding protein MlaC [Thiomicrospira sp. WB1]|uniref:MlaC/ttg2D family ABC transporter substrate-binding protein n=1 Tax=Thiomicrospira sp. WB1 TaxID=1685380 RepID=UPI0007491E63|nr:ABC transporter substrate-binding protein [Thiomicrospira sp. WB1]KUJ72869.1 toluene tolerance protein [Thiomicrospira sp. WB1]